jgi:hypothetical protein
LSWLLSWPVVAAAAPPSPSPAAAAAAAAAAAPAPAAMTEEVKAESENCWENDGQRREAVQCGSLTTSGEACCCGGVTPALGANGACGHNEYLHDSAGNH